MEEGTKKDYFIVNLINNKQILFNKMCNSVDYSNDKVVIFKHNYDDGVRCKCLGMVPINQILSIINMSI